MDPKVNMELLEGGFRSVHLDVDVDVGGHGGEGGPPDGAAAGTGDQGVNGKGEDDGCTEWEYKLHRENITDGPRSSSAIRFSSRSDLCLFLDATRDAAATGNPFGDGAKALVLCPEGEAEADNLTIYFDLAKQLVQSFGKGIQEVEVKLWEMGDPFEVHAFLIAILKKLPNLKALHLNLRMEPGNRNTPFFEHFDENAEIQPASKLEYLNFRLYNSSDVILLAPIFAAYCKNLKKISVTPFTWDLLAIDSQKLFVDLQEFNMCWYSNQCQSVNIDAMYTLFAEDFAPKLEKLRLLYTDCSHLERPVEWLFKVLQKFKRLILLNLTGFELTPPPDNRLLRDLPVNGTLRSLKFQDHAEMKYDFLVKFTGLENLFIEGSRFRFSYETEEDTYEAEEGEVKLRCYLYRKELSKSNVWEKVPSLKKIVFERYAESGKVPPEVEEYLKM